MNLDDLRVLQICTRTLLLKFRPDRKAEWILIAETNLWAQIIKEKYDVCSEVVAAKAEKNLREQQEANERDTEMQEAYDRANKADSASAARTEEEEQEEIAREDERQMEEILRKLEEIHAATGANAETYPQPNTQQAAT